MHMRNVASRGRFVIGNVLSQGTFRDLGYQVKEDVYCLIFWEGGRDMCRAGTFSPEDVW